MSKSKAAKTTNMTPCMRCSSSHCSSADHFCGVFLLMHMARESLPMPRQRSNLDHKKFANKSEQEYHKYTISAPYAHQQQHGKETGNPVAKSESPSTSHATLFWENGLAGGALPTSSTSSNFQTVEICWVSDSVEYPTWSSSGSSTWLATSCNGHDKERQKMFTFICIQLVECWMSNVFKCIKIHQPSYTILQNGSETVFTNSPCVGAVWFFDLRIPTLLAIRDVHVMFMWVCLKMGTPNEIAI